MAITGDVFNVFVFLEISALSSYAMIALGRDRRALTASYRYLVMGTVGATHSRACWQPLKRIAGLVADPPGAVMRMAVISRPSMLVPAVMTSAWSG